ncbi:MAG: phosphodiester glycosidase family protein [Clostridia bacterium]|nr:phosphodiester glycosidase family protein [Clostridia bacterium]
MRRIITALGVLTLYAGVLGLGCLSPGAARAEGGFVAGDANGDGVLSAADAAVLLRSNLSLPPDGAVNLGIADITGNGALDDTDARVMLHASIGLIPDIDAFQQLLKDQNIIAESHFDRFSYTGIVQQETETEDGFVRVYRTDSVSVTITSRVITHGKRSSNTCVADIFVRRLDNFRTGLSNDAFHAARVRTVDQAVAKDAVVAISGDFYDFSGRTGLCCRNGEWYRTTTDSEDICVMYYDGRMETLLSKTYDAEVLVAAAPYQVWGFGPALLDENGNAKERFNSALTANNPRSAMGYYEPGHYCFVLVDGSRNGATRNYGFTLTQLSELFFELGCTTAFNLDGGGTAVMASRDGLLSQPSGQGREVSDIVYIAD